MNTNKLNFIIIMNSAIRKVTNLLLIMAILSIGKSHLVRAEEFTIANGDSNGLIEALNTANNNGVADTIHLANEGLYLLNIVDNRSSGTNGLPLISSEVTINGNRSTIERNRAGNTPKFRILHINKKGKLTINDLTIQGGQVASNGGAILNEDGMVSMANVTIIENESEIIIDDGQLVASQGGGIYNTGTLSLENSQVIRNTAQGEEFKDDDSPGGGIFNEETGKITLTNCMVSNNVGGEGAGIFNNGTVTVQDSSISDNDAGRAFNGGGIFNNGDITISDSTISGNRSFLASGILNNGKLMLVGSTVSDNNDGGGIGNFGGTVTISATKISKNRMENLNDGGGILSRGGTLTITDSIIDRNFADFSGGGIKIEGSEVSIKDSSIFRNEANAIQGGGISNDGGTLMVMNSVIANNSSSFGGGGIYNTKGTVTVINSTIRRNKVDSFGSPSDGGGGILNEDGTMMINNSTIARNIADGKGGGIHNIESTVELQNTLLARNKATDQGPDCSGSITSLGNNLISDPTNCNIVQLPTDLNGDSGLAEFIDDRTSGNGHIPLLPNSQAIDAGNNEDCPETDQLGNLRPVDGNGDGIAGCDIGAVEFQADVSPQGSLKFKPVADSTIKRDLPTENFGSKRKIKTDNRALENFLIKFSVSEIGQRKVASAILRLFCINNSNKGGDFHHIGNGWSENKVTWNNAPAANREIVASLGPVAIKTWVEVDLSSLITKNGIYSFRVITTSNNGADYRSRENKKLAPELIITLQDQLKPKPATDATIKSNVTMQTR